MQNKPANTDSMKKDLKIYLSILKDSWMYQLAIFITFVVTLAVFPAVTALVQPLSKGMKMQLVMLIHTNIFMLEIYVMKFHQAIKCLFRAY